MFPFTLGLAATIARPINWSGDALLAAEGIAAGALLCWPMTRRPAQMVRCRLCGAPCRLARRAPRAIAGSCCPGCYGGLLFARMPEAWARLGGSIRARQAWLTASAILHDAVLHGCHEPRDVAELRMWLRTELARQETMARSARRAFGGYFGAGAAALAIAAAALDGRAATAWRA